MSQELEMRILAKVDEALAEIRRLSEQATEALEEIKNANEQVAEAEEETTASARELALGFSGLVGSGVSLYVGLTNLERANYQVERAHYLVKKAAEDVEGCPDESTMRLWPNMGLKAKRRRLRLKSFKWLRKGISWPLKGFKCHRTMRTRRWRISQPPLFQQ
jgi:uncharacterized membrane protein YccC